MVFLLEEEEMSAQAQESWCMFVTTNNPREVAMSITEETRSSHWGEMVWFVSEEGVRKWSE